MRISTASLYNAQTNALTNQQAQLAQYASQLSTGKTLNAPSDNPTLIATDLALTSDIAQQKTNGQVAQLGSDELTTTDGALSTLTDIVQKANTLTVQAASDTQSPQDRAIIGNQINQLLNQAISIGNTQYNGKYIFAGTAVTPNGPVQAVGNPPTSVAFTGNNETITQEFPGGQQLALSTSLQQAFNVDAADGSPDIFQTLINLRDELEGNGVSIQSASGINATGQVIAGSTTLGTAQFATPLKPDGAGDYAMQISGSAGTATITLTPADTLTSTVAAINAQTAATGVSASYNAKTERIALSSSQAFSVTDVPSAGSTTSANLVEALGLQTTGSSALDLSGQLYDIQNALQVALNARGAIGTNIQVLSTVEDQTAQTSTTETAAKSSIEDTDVAKASTAFTLSQTALQAAYLTTSKIEATGNMLFNYISS